MKVAVLLTWLLALGHASFAYAGEPSFHQLLECVTSSAGYRGIAGELWQTQIFAEGCGALACPGIAELGHSSQIISSEAVWNQLANKCDLFCSPEARARFTAAPPDEKAPTLIAACGAKYYGATERAAPLFSARWFALERIARSLGSARAHATGDSAVALAKIQKTLKETAKNRVFQFELDLPAIWQGHYRLAHATRTRVLADASLARHGDDVYVIVDGDRLTVARTPRAVITPDGLSLTSEPFPGDVTQPSELVARLEKLRRLDPLPPIEPPTEKEEEIPDWLKRKRKPRPSDATFTAVHERAPLLLVDRQLAVARVAAILGVLGESGGRLAIGAADGTVHEHEVLLTTKQVALKPSAPRLVLAPGAAGFAASLEQAKAQAKGSLIDVVWLSGPAATTADLASALDIAAAHQIRLVVLEQE